MELSEAQIDMVVARLQGTCDSVSSALEVLELDADPMDVEAQIANDLERCAGCE